jgi:hypothetical protein
MIPFAGLSNALADFLTEQSWINDGVAEGTAQIVGIRGCQIQRGARGDATALSITKEPARVTDLYDDAIVVFGRKANGDRYSDAFRASTQPGRASFSRPDYRGKGCPTVQPGQYRYQQGLHCSRSGRCYPAMQQAGHVLVIRDLDQNAVLTPEDVWDYPSAKLNIHAGGTDPSQVGGWSEGCQVIFGGRGAGSPWERFHHLIYGVASNQGIFHYTVIDGTFLAEWWGATPGARETLRWLWFGSQGERVKALQARLAELGHYHVAGIDGDFGVKTHQAVRRYERVEGLTETGVVTDARARQLGVA